MFVMNCVKEGMGSLKAWREKPLLDGFPDLLKCKCKVQGLRTLGISCWLKQTGARIMNIVKYFVKILLSNIHNQKTTDHSCPASL